MAAIDSQEHARHADGFIAALADRTATYRADPAPAMRKRPLPAIMLTQDECKRVMEWYEAADGISYMEQEDEDLAFMLELAALGDKPEPQSEAAPGFPRARDFNETPASEWEKLEGNK